LTHNTAIMTEASKPQAPRWQPEPAIRVLDLVLSLVALAQLSVLLPLLAVAIKLDSRGTVFFHQARLGRLGRPLRVVKFRTMVANAPGLFNPDGSRIVGKTDARVTRVGRLLRLGIDELPQVFNVLRGQMGFIGPRPDDLHALQNYQGVEWLKLADRPGLTGLAQVSGRNDLAWRDRIRYDVYYHYKRSLKLDLAIVWRTLALLLKLEVKRPLVDPLELERLLADPKVLAEAEQLRQHVLAQQVQPLQGLDGVNP
jgi:undecaprenyl phosphate N,N'-diacetylbacillosamine 1-phosphate transferase